MKKRISGKMKKLPSRVKRTPGVVAKAKPKRKQPRKNSAAKRLAMPAHIHPYGVTAHGDLDWHLAKHQKLMKKFPAERQEKVGRAYELAKERHADQVRHGGMPYIIHPVRIANILMSEWGVEDANVVAAALLHDVVEDTRTTVKEIKDEMGDEIGRLVDGLTMWKGSETYELYCKRVARGSDALRLIKCADVLDNLRSWHEIENSEVGLPRWWRRVNDYILPMADTTYPPAGMTIRSLLNDKWYLKMAEME